MITLTLLSVAMIGLAVYIVYRLKRPSGRASVAAAPERIRPAGCQVGGCRIRGKHSHTEALINRMKDKR